MGRSKKIIQRNFLNPRDEYVYSLEDITIKELAEKWKGKPGCSFRRLLDRSTEEKWVQKRQEYRIKIAKKQNLLIEKTAIEKKQELIEEIRLNHHKLGNLFINTSGALFNDRVDQTTICPHCKKKVNVPFRERMSPQAAIRAGQVGVDIQRKGLGLDDLHFHFNETKQVIFNVMEVIQKYVTEPDLYKSIKRGLFEIVRREQANLDEAMTGGQTIDVLHSKIKGKE